MPPLSRPSQGRRAWQRTRVARETYLSSQVTYASCRGGYAIAARQPNLKKAGRRLAARNTMDAREEQILPDGRAHLDAADARHEVGVLHDVFRRRGVADVGIVEDLQHIIEIHCLGLHGDEDLRGCALVG